MPSEPTEPTNSDLYSHENEIRTLRLALSRLEAKLAQATDPADLVRVSGAIARVSNSIVRALAAHHKLAELAEKSKLKEEWARLEEAREKQLEVEKHEQRERALWFRVDQGTWLQRLAEAAHEAGAGDPAVAKEIASGLDAYIAATDYTYPPDRYILARMRNEAASAQSHTPQGGSVPLPANRSERDPVVQLR